MTIEILMPALSPTMEEGKLARWTVKEGDEVSSGDVIAEIETDKATMEVEAVDEGRLGKILVPEGTDGVKVNEVIAVLLEEDEDESALDAAPKSNGGGPDADSHVAPSPDEPPSDVGAQGGYGRGEAPRPHDAGPSPTNQPGKAPSTGAPSTGETSAPASSGGGRIFASPLARRIAKEKGLDLATLKGSGPHGRIVKADVENAEAGPKPAARPQAEAPKADKAEQPAREGPDPTKPGVGKAEPASYEAIRKIYSDRPFEEVQLDGMRRTIGQRLSEAKQTIPHFYLRRDILLDELLAFRKQMNAKGEKRGVKLSVNDYVIKASALSLKAVPDCNAVWAGDRILKLKAVDVAVAVAIEGGLFTPVLRDADQKSLSTLSAEMKDLATRARERKLKPHEYQGGTYAISNLGMFGIENFDAVINPPHASILAVGAGVEKPIVRDGALATATVMSVTLSVDHRVIDGALGAQFLDALKGYLEDPMAMLM